jgi:hypothetical protein
LETKVREELKHETKYKDYHESSLPVKHIKAHQVKIKTKKMTSFGGGETPEEMTLPERRIRLFIIVGCYL